MSALSKLELFLKSASAQRGVNWRGFPLLPKRLVPLAPSNRAAFNQFVLWIEGLRLPRIQSVMDVGANHGDFAQAVSALNSRAEITLVEPLPKLKAHLERLCKGRNGRWQLMDCALGSQAGTARLYVDKEDDAIGSLVGFSDKYLEANPLATGQYSVECRVATLDELCAAQGIKRIDLLKIDVEGFEFEVLAGAKRMLPSTLAIIVEISLIRRAETARDGLLEMLGLLRNHGFEIVNVIPSLFASQQPWKPVEFNVLARRPDLESDPRRLRSG